MNREALVKKFVQVTEENQKPIHVPVVFGNECFIVTQQDLRKIEDIRLLSYSKLGPNGELIPMESLGHDFQARDAILSACKYRLSDQITSTNDIQQLMQFINMLNASHDIEMRAPPVASVQQQLEWGKRNSSVPFPFSRATGTLTEGRENINTGCCCCRSCSTSNKTVSFCSRGSNTMDMEELNNVKESLSAREQLKKKKMWQGLNCCCST